MPARSLDTKQQAGTTIAEDAELDLLWLGEASVRRAGEPLIMETRKATAMLAYLSLNPRRCTRDMLAALCWPGYDEQHALGNLRRVLASLNTRLGKHWLSANNESIALVPSPLLRVDVLQFRSCLDACRHHEHLDIAACADCLHVLEKAVSIYRGDFLQGLNLPDCPEFDEWQFLERDALRRDLGWALEMLISGCVERTDWHLALTHARRWVGLDRLDEKAQRTLIEIYSRAGNRAAALRQYDECKRILEHELGQAPESDTTRLYENIRSGLLGAKHIVGEQAAHAQEYDGELSGSRSIMVTTTPIPVIETKLFVPQPRAQLVQRTRLLKRLDDGTAYPLTLISAPAGFGKTTLLSTWAAQSRLPVAWVSLDVHDNEPQHFFRYIAQALQRAEGNLNTTALAHHREMDLALAQLINMLHLFDGPLVMVLDDYQAITSAVIHEAVTFLLDHMPPSLHLVISTRSDPPLPLSRLRARGQMAEIRANMLRFTYAEAAEFLNLVMQLELAEEDVARLAERTEGWIAGLQMAALSMQGRNDLHEFIQAFSGSNRYILDYLLEEVLRGQPEELQRFLLHTSILDRLCGPLCDAVTAHADGGCLLAELERTNLFIVSLDDERRWYRYHHLFADLLQSRLMAGDQDIIKELHMRASAWYVQNEQYTAAVNHACEAGNYDRAAEILEQAGQAMWNSSEISAFNWPSMLPRETLRLRPWLCVHRAWKCLITGNMIEAESWLGEAESHVHPEHPLADRQDLLGFTSVMHALVADYRGDMSRTLKMAEIAVTNLSESKAGMRNIVLYVQAFAHFMNGNFNEAATSFEKSVENDHAGITSNTTAAAMSKLARLRIFEGRLGEAARICRESLHFVEQRGVEKFYTTGNLNVTLSEVLYERNDIEKALEEVGKGIERNRKWNISNSFCYQHMLLSRILLAKGDLAGANTNLAIAQRLNHERLIALDIKGELEAWSLRLLLASGDRVAARQWACDVAPGLNPDGPFVFRRESEYLALARLYLAEERFAEALALLAHLRDAAQAGGRTGRLIEILNVTSISLQKVGKLQQALDSLRTALSLAEPEGYIRTFVDEGASLLALLKMGLANGRWQRVNLQEYATTLVEAFRDQIVSTLVDDGTKKPVNMVEPLSEREKDVLRLLSAGLSYRRIASELVVAVGTIKTHIHNIYSKLNARNKVEAIRRAGELSLL